MTLPMTKRLSIQSHPHILPPAWPRPGGTADGGGPVFDWAALVPRIVHPARVAIVEALFYIGQPLSATELRDLFDEPECYYLSIVSYHLGKLVGYGALAETGSRQVRGATETYYFFPSPSDGKAAR
jgi:hypothetical protein